RISLAGRNFNEAIIRYLRKKHHLEIGPSTAEAVKCEIGSVFPREKVISCHVKGRSLVSGLPDEIILTSDEMVEALIDPTLQIAKAVEACLEFIPPEILSDIARSGITLVGGSARIFGLDKFIEKRVKLPTAVIENPEEAVINGAGKALGLLAKAENPRSFVGALSFKK
ncbi:MAG: rod shape-determining protein, partial [Oscillospiraceae bacterium]